MIKYGLKLWSTNEELFDKSIKSVKSGFFDFIELYVIPGKLNKETLNIFVENNAKISIHAPHSAHGFNPIDKDNNSEEIWKEIKQYIDFLKPFQIVMHPEIGNDLKILEERLKYFNDKRILIENMPKKSAILKDTEFFGYSLEQIKNIKKINSGFCFDFAKAKSSANSQKLDIINFYNDLLLEMTPNYFHISGFLSDTEVDEHFDLWEGDSFLIKWMKNKLIKIGEKKDIFIVFECKKKNGIGNDLKNLGYFKILGKKLK